MTNEELLEIARRGGEEGKVARDKLIVGNKGIVRHIFFKYNFDKQDYEDFCQTGFEGLIKGVDALIRKGLKEDGRVITFLARCAENEMLMEMHKRLKLKAEQNSIYEPIDDENNLCLIDLLTSSDNVEEEAVESLTIAHIKNIIECKLSKNQAQIIKSRYFSDRIKSLQETAQEAGITREGVRQIELRAIRKIKKLLEGENS